MEARIRTLGASRDSCIFSDKDIEVYVLSRARVEWMSVCNGVLTITMNKPVSIQMVERGKDVEVRLLDKKEGGS